MSKADPKHGRWILPLVIGGLVGFTFLFVNALPPGTVEAGGGDTEVTTTIAPPEGGEGDGGTTPTEPAGNAEFLAAVEAFATQGAGFAEEAQTINSDWDDRTIEFAAARDRLTSLRDRTATFAAEVAAAEVPPEATDSWADVVTAAEAMSTAGADMLTGLVDSEGPDDRQNALQAYTTGAGEFSTALAAARTAAGG